MANSNPYPGSLNDFGNGVNPDPGGDGIPDGLQTALDAQYVPLDRQVMVSQSGNTITEGQRPIPRAIVAAAWEATDGAVTQDGDAVVLTRTNTDGGTYSAFRLDFPMDMRNRYVVVDWEGLDANRTRIWFEYMGGASRTTQWAYDAIDTTVETATKPGRSESWTVSPQAMTAGGRVYADAANFWGIIVRVYGPSPGTSTAVKIHSVTVVDTIPPPGAVIPFFDDGWANVHTYAFPKMEANGQVGTVSVETSNVGGTNRMTLAQLHDLYDAGWDICSHGVTGAQNESLANLRTARQWLITNGFDRGKDHFVYGGGAIGNIDDVRRVYLSGRSVSGGPQAHWPITDRYRYHGGRTHVPATTTATIDSDLTSVANLGGVVASTFHDIVLSAPTGVQILQTTFDHWSDKVAELGIATLGVDAVFGDNAATLRRLLP
jgi:hypothetical protein